MEFINKYYPDNLSNFLVNTFDCSGVKLNLNSKDEQMGDLTFNLGVINVSNDNIHLGYNMRLPKDELLDKINNTYKEEVLKYNLKFDSYTYSKAHYVDPNSDLVVKLMSAYQEVTGDLENKPFTIGGGTYAREIEGAVAFGPMFLGREDVVHQPNEYILLEDFKKWILIYVNALIKVVE